MVRYCQVGWWSWVGVCVAAAWFPAASSAGDRVKSESKPQAEAIELFAGIEKGQIEVQLIPKDATQCNLLVTNKTDKPLTVRLPWAFAGVPVLAQVRPGQNPAIPAADAPQRISTTPDMPSFPWGQNQRGRGQGGPFNVNQRRGQIPGVRPFFDIEPEKVAKLKMVAVCLDHGKPNPRPAVKYDLKPLASVVDKEGLAEVVAMLGRGEISQHVAQLVAWHLSNDMSWEKLASLQHKVAFGTRPTYSRDEIDGAKKALEKGIKAAKDRPRESENRPSTSG